MQRHPALSETELDPTERRSERLRGIFLARNYDALVIGAGHNALVCAAYLGRAGLKVLVLEGREEIGGAARTIELWPGIKVSRYSYMMSLLQSKIIKELELGRHGYRLLPNDGLFTPFEDGSHLMLWNDVKRTAAEVRRFSAADAQAYPAFDQKLNAVANAFRRLLWLTPPTLSPLSLRSASDLLALAREVRLSGDLIYDLIDVMTMSVKDYVDEWFESDEIKAVLSYYSGIGHFAGPMSQGTAYVLLHHLMGEGASAGGWGFIEGGMGSVSNALAAAARERGVEIRVDAPVRRILVEKGASRGVELASGEVIAARTVISGTHAKTTFLDLLPSAELPGDFLRHIRTYRSKSSTFRVNLVLRGLPSYTAFDAGSTGLAHPPYMHVAPSVEYLERAYDDAKYGAFSQRPYFTTVVPSVKDETLAPKGLYVVNIFGGHAPYALKGGWNMTQREALYEAVLTAWDVFAPGVRELIVHHEIMVPPDLESLVGLPGGNIFHGNLDLDQIFIQRPAPKYADYRSPIRGVYQCGASTHPGGGVMGVAGHNAAREVLRDRRWFL
jgi:phytoene dehydrogenase-like protein